MKVFLGGTCNGSSWRDRIIPMLEIDYFNPVVENWTPECQEEEIKQRKECDFVLYVITPKMKGVYSIAEVIDDTHRRGGCSTIFVPLETDDELIFDAAQWKSLLAVAEMVNKNNSMIFYNLEQAAKFMNDWPRK